MFKRVRDVAQWASLVAAGMVGGAIASAYAGSRAGPREPAAPPTVRVIEVHHPAPLSNEHERGVARETAPATEHPAAAPRADEAPSHPNQPTEQEARAQHQSDFQRALDEHRRESVDGNWAREANRSLESDARELAPRAHATFGAADCRMTTCAIEATWSDFDAARRGYAALLEYPFTTNCAAQIVIPEPSDRSLPVRASLLLDCEGVRTGEIH